MNAEQVRSTITAMLCADSGCEPSQLTDGQVHIVARKPEHFALPESRKFDPHPGRINIATLGTGAVISVDDDYFEEASRIFRSLTRDDIFLVESLQPALKAASDSGLKLYGPFPRFTCPSQSLKQIDAPGGYTVSVVDIEAEDAANGHSIDRSEFPNSLFATPERARSSARSMAFAAVARSGEEIAGIAGVYKDTDYVWQIGIDVLESHRGLGLAPALTSAAAQAVFDTGALPYYGCSNSNIPSMRTALAVGFRPMWVEVLTRPA